MGVELASFLLLLLPHITPVKLGPSGLLSQRNPPSDAALGSNLNLLMERGETLYASSWRHGLVEQMDMTASGHCRLTAHGNLKNHASLEVIDIGSKTKATFRFLLSNGRKIILRGEF